MLSWCDDSHGTLGTVFATALSVLGALAAAARLPTDQLVDQVFDSVCDNDHGQFHGLVTLMTEPLGEAGLKSLRRKFEAMAREVQQWPPQGERRVIGFGSGGVFYEDEMEARRHERLVRQALVDIADALGDVDAFIAQCPADQRHNPAIAAAIAERLLAAGRAAEAIAALDAAEAIRRKGGHWPNWDRVRIAALDALGHAECAQCG